MKTSIIRAALLPAALLFLAACSGDRPAPAETYPSGAQTGPGEPGPDGHDEAAGAERVKLSAAAAEKAGIRISEANLGPVSAQLELPAEIRFDADRVARISPKVEGVIERLYAGEGDTVAAGETLALLSSRELAGLKADYLNAVSAERLAEAELEREERLWDQKITAEADVQAARAGFSAANAARAATENRLHAVGVGHAVLDRLDQAGDGASAQAYVTAPISGQIIQRPVSLGETVSMGGDAMFVIIDDTILWADIAVYKEDLGQIETGLNVVLQRADGEDLATGSIATVLPVIDETSRTATARMIVENPAQTLKSGQFVTALIETGESEQVLRVPDNAIVSVENRPSVFVPAGDGFEPRRVRTGHTAGGFTVIVSGLSSGDRFVSEGAFTLKAQLEKDAFGDGHGH